MVSMTSSRLTLYTAAPPVPVAKATVITQTSAADDQKTMCYLQHRDTLGEKHHETVNRDIQYFASLYRVYLYLACAQLCS